MPDEEQQEATGNEPHDIGVEDAGVMTARYREAHGLEKSKGFYYGKTKILSLLEPKDCVGIRIYYAIGDDDKETLVIIGVDKDWNDYFPEEKTAAEYGASTAEHADSAGSPLAG